MKDKLYGYDAWYGQAEKIAKAYNMDVTSVLCAVKLLMVGCPDRDVKSLITWYYAHDYMQEAMGAEFLKLNTKGVE